ncbi:MAG: CHAD domain-containing protein [Candidatus Hydrogenedentes bacterium]|nr:CHAD domain-containing protein [Candidatus Hydrogenedentota bacterium]
MTRLRCARAHSVARRALRERAATLRRNVRAAAAHDVEGIHDLRVASRRLRAVLADHAPYYRKRALKPFRKQVRSITRGLGTARELDVTVHLLRDWRKRLPKSSHPAITAVLRRLRMLRETESGAVDASCGLARSPQFRAAYDALIENMKPPKRCYLAEVIKTIKKRYADLAMAYTAWQDNASDEHLHAVRIAFKKLRYSCEICQPVYGSSMAKFIAKLKKDQESLGAWNDQRILRNHVVASAAELPSHAKSLGILIARIDGQTARLLSKFTKTVKRWPLHESPEAALQSLGTPARSCCEGRRNAASKLVLTKNALKKRDRKKSIQTGRE